MALKWLVFLKNCKNCLVAGSFALPPGPPLSNLAFLNWFKNVQNVIRMALKWLHFFWKIARIAQRLELCPQAPIGVTCYLSRNLHNQQLSKSLLQGFWISKCCNDAAVTTKSCLTITKLAAIGYWLLFEKFKPPFKNFWVCPWPRALCHSPLTNIQKRLLRQEYIYICGTFSRMFMNKKSLFIKY